ncbi:MAG: ubiquitin-conjugating enzyme E2 [Bacteroidia bacterium]|nr:ubiquitin-conjugating enzyme E2 [Bacteroidia bacterium]
MDGQEAPKYHLESIANPFLRRLAREHLALHAVCAQSDVISYRILEKHDLKPHPPLAYQLTYEIKTIVRLDENQDPVYGHKHEARIKLTSRYPVEPPECYMLSEVWHPNIKSAGTYKGRICGNTRDFGKAFDIGSLVIRIGEILQYRNYHALNIDPFPEDETVARWVREIAEPMGLVNIEQGIAIDDTPLQRPTPPPAADPVPEPPPAPETPKMGIVIKDSRQGNTSHVKFTPIRKVDPTQPD